MYTNKNSRIVQEISDTSALARSTFTDRRDEGTLVAALHTDSGNATDFVIQMPGFSLQLSGHQARTLQRLLNRHYEG